MNAREAFKFGFMSACVDAGHTTVEEIHELAVKAASGPNIGNLLLAGEYAKGFGELGTAAVSGLKDVGIVGGVGALAAPPVLGYGLGRLAGGVSNSLDDYDPEDVKRRETIDEYRRQAARMRQQGLMARGGPRPF